MSDHVATVACVLRTGGIYTSEWVERLHAGVMEHTSVPVRFVCLTDDEFEIDGVERVALVHGWPTWWSKIELFRPNLWGGTVLYLDLDTIVVADLAPVLAHPHKFTMVRDYYKPRNLCSTAMAWNGSQQWGIWETFKRNPRAYASGYVMGKHHRVGDQGFIQDMMAKGRHHVDTFQDLFGEKAVASYKVHKCDKNPPREAFAVAFHGKPKPSDIRVGWVAEAWTRHEEVAA